MVTEISVKIVPGKDPAVAERIAADLHEINDARCFDGLQPVKVELVDTLPKSTLAPAAATTRSDINVKLDNQAQFVDMEKVVRTLKEFYVANFGTDPDRVNARTGDAES